MSNTQRCPIHISSPKLDFIEPLRSLWVMSANNSWNIFISTVKMQKHVIILYCPINKHLWGLYGQVVYWKLILMELVIWEFLPLSEIELHFEYDDWVKGVFPLRVLIPTTIALTNSKVLIANLLQIKFLRITNFPVGELFAVLVRIVACFHN